MFDLPIILVKGGDSSLDFFDDDLAKFPNHRVCTSAVDALLILEDAPASVVVTEMEVGDMNGIELAEAIRDIDEDQNHYTHIILFGARQSSETIAQPDFHDAIDVVTGTKRNDVLEHQILAGARISHQLNELKRSNDSLQRLCTVLRKGQRLDSLTGFGNRAYAEQSLRDTISQIDSRGGAVCLVMISIANFDEVIATYDQSIADELVLGVSQRIRHLVRPLDVVTYFEPGKFALILMQPTIEQCTADCYQRIFDGTRLKSYSTAAGFQSARIAMSLCASVADSGPPNPQMMIDTTLGALQESLRTEAIIVHHIKPE